MFALKKCAIEIALRTTADLLCVVVGDLSPNCP